MSIEKLKTIYFSPGKKTAKIVKLLVESLNIPSENHNITSYKKRNEKIVIDEKELIVFANPIYGGRIPAIAADEYKNIKGKNNPAVILAVYGNGSYGDALLEMQEIIENKGFKAIAAGAFIANHSIMRRVAVNRPDENDKEVIDLFAKKIKEKLENIKDVQKLPKLKVKGKYPYRRYPGMPLKPAVIKHKCDLCGACVINCPVNAIPKENPMITDQKKCISCMGCHIICTRQARKINVILYELCEFPFRHMYNKRKEPEFFI